MADQPHIKALGEHDYLIRVLEGEDMIEIRVHASQAVLDRLPVDTDENRLVEATAVFLIQRQRADDLPASLDLDDVAAAYDGYIEEMAAQLSTGTGGR
jgi:hypothetical protein